MNCEIVDTPYGVLQNVANRFVENLSQRIPFTGLSTDRVYQMLVEKLDEEKRIVILVLDEIDKIVTKNGDDLLYQLLKINDDLTKAKVSLIGISNDLKFTEWLDPRVKSRLSDEKMVFPPDNAHELFDILHQSSHRAFDNGVAGGSRPILLGTPPLARPRPRGGEELRPGREDEGGPVRGAVPRDQEGPREGRVPRPRPRVPAEAPDDPHLGRSSESRPGTPSCSGPSAESVRDSRAFLQDFQYRSINANP